MSEKYSIKYSREALEDLDEIYEYIAFDLCGGQYAQNQVDRIINALDTLETFPEAFSVVDWEPWKSRRIHKVPVDSYVVFYEVNRDSLSVTIIGILLGSMDIENAVKSEYDPKNK